MRELLVCLVIILVIRKCGSLKRAALEEKKFKAYPCPSKESWCRGHKDYTPDYSCHTPSWLIASQATEEYKLYPICDQDFKPYEKAGEIVCRAAQHCFVHTLDKIYGHGDKMGKELDDSLGVEKSGRVPSGPYNMHIDLKECYPNTKGVLTQHYSPHADKFVYYCTSTWYFRDCYEFYKACDV
uniref:Uncharacterized protein n=1 Tax=Meloidogyne incognita TaxID=6306 RepID=A0A914KQT1_MELIC